MKISPYHLLRSAAALRSARLRLLGAWLLSVCGLRYVGVFLDPVLSCNLRCQMCYFSDEERRKSLRGSLSAEDLERVANSVLPRALKVQIGCGAEPTLSQQLPQMVRMAKAKGVPYVSVTTNGQLLTEALLCEMLTAGLDEVTLSLHGLTKATYEELMTGASFEKFQHTITLLQQAKKDFPSLKIRLNFTINRRNLSELPLLTSLIEQLPTDIVQLRAVQRIGNTVWQDFSAQPLLEEYDRVLQSVCDALKQRGVTVLMPTREDLQNLTQRASVAEETLQRLVYLQIDPQSISAMRLPRLSIKELWRAMWGISPKKIATQDVTKKMAYHIQ